MIKNLIIIMAFCGLFIDSATAQKLAKEKYISSEEHILYTGGKPSEGFYDASSVKNIYLYFPQANYWNLLTNNYNSGTDLLAKLAYEGETFDSIGVRFKGQTSYQGARNSQKKSFNISLDFVRSDQKVMGYKTLNLNNAYQDPSFMKEVLYLHLIRKHIPAAKANYVQLYINDQLWGIYPNIQQLNRDFLKEWFISDDGTNWRADVPDGSGIQPGGRWGDGTAALNFLGNDTNQYKKYYTLKSTRKANPWEDLVRVCSVLANTPLENLEKEISEVMDLDRTLWFLASEILLADDDSYVFKGKMDYYVYLEAETGRMAPIEFDGNSAFYSQGATWSPFYNAEKVNYPLLNRLLAVQDIRQRYLAHFRTLINEILDTAKVYPVIETYRELIVPYVQADPKKLNSYNQFVTGVQSLKSFILNRRNYLLNNAEIKQIAPSITEAAHYCDGEKWKAPSASKKTLIKARVSSTVGVSAVYLHYAQGFTDDFSKAEMLDDGANGDETALDGIYTAYIPEMPGGVYVRYYIEALSNNAVKSKSFLPEGAVHNVFIYQTAPGGAISEPSRIVTINEFMASNSKTAADEAGEYDDWIELFNPSSNPIDISGFYLSDKADNLVKWRFPQGTIINGKDYLIIWADENKSQGPLHANFKLSADGEEIFLLNSLGELVDSVSFGAQIRDTSCSRIPNGIGSFVLKNPTFGINNEAPAGTEYSKDKEFELSIYPNPANNHIEISGILNADLLSELSRNITIYNSIGAIALSNITVNFAGSKAIIDISSLQAGAYFLRIGSKSLGFLVIR